MKNIGASFGEAMNFFPAVCYIYLELFKVAKSCRFDGDIFAFPFLEEQLNTVWYTSKYGERWERKHYGIDLATDGNMIDVHAIADGVVVSNSGWEAWNAAVIEHENNHYSRYLHCSEVCVSAGQSVKKGEVIAKVGGTGPGGPNAYAYHLHLEISKGDPLSHFSDTDPSGFFPTLEEKFGDGGSPLADR